MVHFQKLESIARDLGHEHRFDRKFIWLLHKRLGTFPSTLASRCWSLCIKDTGISSLFFFLSLSICESWAASRIHRSCSKCVWFGTWFERLPRFKSNFFMTTIPWHWYELIRCGNSLLLSQHMCMIFSLLLHAIFFVLKKILARRFWHWSDRIFLTHIRDYSLRYSTLIAHGYIRQL